MFYLIIQVSRVTVFDYKRDNKSHSRFTSANSFSLHKNFLCESSTELPPRAQRTLREIKIRSVWGVYASGESKIITREI